jgi:ATP-dependent Lhr-like helicase
MSGPGHPSLDPFHPIVRDWFGRSFPEPTDAQAQGWPAIAAGHHALILAPTGSGKTLAAFLWALNQLVVERMDGGNAGRVLYVSPLKALNYDVERNLRGPLTGLAAGAARLGMTLPEISVGVRTGDTSQAERQRMLREPPDILITTPESLFLMLTSRAAEILAPTQVVIVDEIHAVAATKRGSHLALSLERLEGVADGPVQRIGLSATQRPLAEIARFLGGSADGRPRPVTVVDAGSRKPMELEVVVPVDDMRELGGADAGPAAHEPTATAGSEGHRRSIWPAMYPELLELIRCHTSTLVFVNNRRSAERMALRLNELAGEEVARAHHGSVAREQRVQIEEDLKAGRMPAIVATSSLELGIDMGAIDLVVQVESPRSVARGLQRIGRAGHSVGEASAGRIFPKYRGDLLESAAVAERMLTGEIEETRPPALPLDVLAQQIVAICVDGPVSVDDLHELARGAYPFADLSREQLEGVLDMLAGKYPSDEFAELRPRVVWDRVAGTVRGRDNARSLAVQNAGTIPDRGLYGVYLADGTSRVGELDEEMVYEARTGQTFLLGASSWRIEDITRDRVIVSPAPGAPGAIPFWRGEGPGRPYELGMAVGRLTRELADAPRGEAERRLRDECRLDERATRNLLDYLRDQRDATGALPSDLTVVVERFRDEIGDWRLCVLTPLGARIHAPWALALQARLRERGMGEVHALWSDDGIAIHFPDSDELPPADVVLIDPTELEELVVGELAGTALFGARFRENAARALLIPRRRPGQRTPLWQQRLRASALLQVARRYGSFPIILETYRECLNDWFDLPALTSLMERLQRRETALVEADTQLASPFAGSLLFEYVATYMYEDDTPAAERKAQALTLNRDLLRELLGRDELRELIDPGALADVEADLQGLIEERPVVGADALHDLLRRLGDLAPEEVAARLGEGLDAADLLAELAAERRACALMIGGERRWIAAEDAARYRDGLGAVPPDGLPAAFLEPVEDALRGLVARYARCHGPFREDEIATRWQVESTAIDAVLAELEGAGEVARGELRPGSVGREWCDVQVLRRIRRASVAALRKEIEPTDPAALAVFLPAWHGIDRPPARPGPDALRELLGPLQGLALPPEQWEGEVLPRRLGDYSPTWLDELAAAGEVIWVGAGSGRGGGRVALYFRDEAPLYGPPPASDPPDDDAAVALREALGSGAAFWEELVAATDMPSQELFSALWALVWSGEVTNDLWSPLRAPRRLPPLRPPRSRGRGRRGAGRISAVAGRWSPTARLFAAEPPAAERRRALAELLLERHGVLTRSAALAEGVPGGFAALYPELVDLETLGACRRGYFVDGLGGAQFALPGAVERLREAPRGVDPEALVMDAADPAQPYGAALPWPPRREGRGPSRVFGAQVVLVDGEPLLYLHRGGKRLLTLAEGGERTREVALQALAAWITADPRRRVAIETVDGEAVHTSPLAEPLAAAGFRSDLKAMVLRA